MFDAGPHSLTEEYSGADEDAKGELAGSRAVFGSVLQVLLRDGCRLDCGFLARFGATETRELHYVRPTRLWISYALVEKNH